MLPSSAAGVRPRGWGRAPLLTTGGSVRSEDVDITLRGWRDRETGTLHLSGRCPAFDEVDARRIEDVSWSLADTGTCLCPWCFPYFVAGIKPGAD